MITIGARVRLIVASGGGRGLPDSGTPARCRTLDEAGRSTRLSMFGQVRAQYPVDASSAKSPPVARALSHAYQKASHSSRWAASVRPVEDGGAGRCAAGQPDAGKRAR